MPKARLRTSAISACIASFFLLTTALNAPGQTFKVLYSFTGGADGGGAWSSLVMDNQGNLYGTTSGGGAYGYGTVYELSPNSDGTWSETVLHSFMLNDPDGANPEGTLILDSAGNLYGTTPSAGEHNSGTAFELIRSSGGWTLQVLYAFGAYRGDAGGPRGGLLMGGEGNLFGAGGGGAIGPGAAFELSPGVSGWTESVIYSFGANKGIGGIGLSTGLTLDAMGNLYGTTLEKGDTSCGGGYGCGTAFKLVPGSSGSRSEVILHTFIGPPTDGANPGYGRLFFDGKGHVYGTTQVGGGTGCSLGAGCGTVYRLTQGSHGWKETLIHEFGNGSEGANPVAGLVFDPAGNAYGTASAGGSTCACGVVYKLAPTSSGHWKYTVLHAFQGSDGAGPSAEVIVDRQGNLYGTTAVGGVGGAGVVFEIIP